MLVLNPALYIGFIGTTAEPLALALISISLFTGSVAAGLAVSFVREMYLVSLANRWYLFVGAVALATVFRFLWIWRFEGSLGEGANAISVPFQGVLAEGSVLAWLVALAGLATLLVGIKSRDFAWILSGILVVTLSPDVFVVPVHAVRAAGILPVLWAFGTTPANFLRSLEGRERPISGKKDLS